MDQFNFLQSEWPEAAAATRAEALAHPDPRACCFYARRALELLVHWTYKYDSSLKLPYQDNLSALLHEPTFKKAAGEAVFSKTQIIVRLGNQAVHSHKTVQPADALAAVRELFHVAYWVARTYGRVRRPAPGLTFDGAALPKTAPIPRQTLDQLRKLEADLFRRATKNWRCVELITSLDQQFFERPTVEFEGEGTPMALRRATAGRLREEIAAMNLNNFIVRPKRRWVEKYSQQKIWNQLDPQEQTELVQELAGLPSELQDEDQEARQFDLIMLRLQLAVLRHESSFSRLREQVQSIARLLEENSSIPMIQAQLRLTQELQTDEFWADVTAPILENVRKRLRDLVKLIERRQRRIVYSDFEDEIGAGSAVMLRGLEASAEFERFRDKARQFLRGRQDEPPIRKLRRNEPLTPDDIAELERMLVAAGIGSEADILRAREESKGVDAFVRSLIGLDREAAKRVFAGFLVGRTLNANQIEFMDLIVNYRTQHGAMDAALLYESPFTDFNPLGVEGVFDEKATADLIGILRGGMRGNLAQ